MKSPRRFYLDRSHDPTAVSGTGIVAYGTLFPNGLTFLAWETEQSGGVFADFAALVRTHCHHGFTKVVWLDQDVTVLGA